MSAIGIHTHDDADRLHTEAAQARAAAAGEANAEPMQTPRGRPERQPVRVRSEIRANLVERDNMKWYLAEGYASAVEQPYEMWDLFGPYNEVVSAGAFAETLAANPQVVYRFNHGGMPMASTSNGRLELWADQNGLGDRAWLNPKRADVQDLIHALDDRDVTEQSFMFTITRGQWSPDYTEYRIEAVNLDRGDVGPVTYGANPYTSIAARSGEFLEAIPSLPPLVAREAIVLLSKRTDIVAAPPVADQGHDEPADLRSGSQESPLAPPVVVAPGRGLGVRDDEWSRQVEWGKADAHAAEQTTQSEQATQPARQGRSIALIRAQLLVDADER